MTQYAKILSVLSAADVEFILIGGVAANIHGSARATFDIDLVYGRSRSNIARIVKALAPYEPYLRGAPPGLPFEFDESTLRNGLNFTFTTSLGPLDLLGEVVGGGGYEDLVPFVVEVEAFGVKCKCVSLEQLIRIKRAAGRPKDLESVAELQLLLQAQRSGGTLPRN